MRQALLNPQPSALHPRPSARLAVIVLAAGQGSRLRSRLPKPLHRAGGRPLIDHVLRAAAALDPAETVVVTGHGAAALREHLALDRHGAGAPAAAGHHRLIEAHQAEQLGTAHAARVGLAAIGAEIETVLLLYADTPLVTAATLTALVAARQAAGAPLALVTCLAPDPTGYGRIRRDAAGRLTGIIEEKVASAAERALGEINAGIYAFDAAWLRAALPRVERSQAGEYYLTDLVALAVAEARPDRPWPVATVSADISEALGINDRVQLAQAEALLRARTLRRLMLAGVTVIDPATTYVDDTVTIGPDTIIYPFTIITGTTTIGADCQIGPHATIDACVIGDGCRVVASMLEQSTMAAGANIGPYSHLRPGAALGPGVHVGNFAEIKNASLGAGTAMGHVGYIGDATVGANVNIGAGTITANYDGWRKHRTTIGDGAFIGCDTILRAPVEVGAGGKTGAGAVVLHDVPPGETVVGLPARPLRRSPGSPGAPGASGAPGTLGERGEPGD
jgi:bifunctional UDP-N-acetylglucosamine pyrophosphorylase/glucosamine-1-phosphate N-acetyltransferase